VGLRWVRGRFKTGSRQSVSRGGVIIVVNIGTHAPTLQQKYYPRAMRPCSLRRQGCKNHSVL
jgi:hypothetical protein